ncbi:MAG: hypothetical protein ACREIF_02150 [Chthoniobacterales bacterium]
MRALKALQLRHRKSNKLFAHLLTRFGLRGQLLQCKHANSQIIWTSSVLSLSEGQFIDAAQKITGDLIVVRDTDDDKPPPVAI